MKLRSTLALLALGSLFAVPTAANADVLFEFEVFVTGGQAPEGDTPWATLFCDDSGDDMVEFTLEFHDNGAGDGEFLSELHLNYIGDVSDLTLGSSDDSVENVTFDQDGFTDAGRVFDIMVDFETANSGGLRVTPGESVSWTFLGSGIECEDFNTLSGTTGEESSVFALLHIQGIGEGDEFSAKVAPVPEPASMGVLALGALGVLARRRRK